MNICKGFLFVKNGTYLTSFIDSNFYNQLLSENLDYDINEEFKNHARLIMNKARINKNISLINEFQSSPFIDYNDWQNSFNKYLQKLRSALLSFNDDSYLITKINSLLKSNININDLSNRLFFTSAINHCFKDMALTSNINLDAVIFVNEQTQDGYKGLSFWFNNDEELTIMSIYKFNIIGSNNFLFNEELSKIISNNFKNYFNNQLRTGLINFNNEEFNLIVNNKLCSTFYNNDKVRLRPLLYFRINDNQVVFTKSLGLNENHVRIITDISINLNAVEFTLFNGKINPLLSCVYLSNNNHKSLLIQHSKDKSIIGIIYELFPGDKRIKEVVSNNLMLLNTYIKNPALMDNL